MNADPPELTAAAYTIPTDRPEADGTLAWTSTTIVVVHAGAAGRTGIGWTYAPAATAEIVTGLLADALQRADPLAVTAAWSTMHAALRNAGATGVGACALSAADTALWDLAAHLQDVPLVRLLGPAARDAVPVYGSGGFTTYDSQTLREQLTGWVERDGTPRVKIKIGEAWGTREDRDLARVAETRETVGDDVAVYVDANGAYHTAQAVRMGRRLDGLGVTWFEEPVSSDDLAGLAHVRGRVDADVAAGEYVWRLPDAALLCAAGAVDCLQLDVTRCGGYTAWSRCAAVAAAHGLDVSGHCAPALHVPVAAATTNMRHLEYFHDHVRIESMIFDGWSPPVAGRLRPYTGGAGHGLRLKDSDAEPYRVR